MRTTATVDESADTRRLVAFYLDERLYGVAIESVQEILQMVEITPIPDAPPHVRGAIDVRGTVVPVLDLRMMLGLPEKRYGLSTPIVLVLGSKRLVGMPVDDVADVLTVGKGQCEAATDEYPLTAAVCRLESEMLLLLDPEKLTAGSLPGLPSEELS